MDRTLRGASTVGPYTAQPAPAVAPHDPPRQADACRSAIGRPIRFCLFATKQTDFHSVNSPAKRDLVGELAAACRKKGLGLCLYYSHGRDWKHPHGPNNDEWRGSARPKYDPPEPTYAYGQDHDLQKYLNFMTAQITELLTN